MNKKQEIVLSVSIIILIVMLVLLLVNWKLCIAVAWSIIFWGGIAIGIFAITKRDAFDSFIKEIFPTRKKQEYTASQTVVEENTTDSNQLLLQIEGKISELEKMQKDTLNKLNNLEQLANNIASRNDSVQSLLQQVTNQKQSVENRPFSLEQNRQNNVISEIVVEDTDSPQYPITCYAQSVDSHNPLGFIDRNLTKNRDKSMFEIIVTSHTDATYHLISDDALLDSMVNMFNPIITDSSEYDSIPVQVNRIDTICDGILQLSNGVWQIIKKQTIKIS
ncbi:MAG: hypothetical protein IKO26_06600 [Paludibacteraceae bacterium]|nr:hypothetical protein [Paludibacteraceae bacterium]